MYLTQYYYYYYYVFILSAISPYTTGLKALFNRCNIRHSFMEGMWMTLLKIMDLHILHRYTQFTMVAKEVKLMVLTEGINQVTMVAKEVKLMVLTEGINQV